MGVNKIIIIISVFILGCASTNRFEKQCTAYGFTENSVELAICVKRETRELRGYLERMEAEDKNKHDSFYRDLERKKQGLDIK